MLQDVCAKKSFLWAPSCQDCSDRLYTSISYMADKEIQAQAIDAFVNSEFCAQFGEENVEGCKGGVKFVLPLAMDVLAQSGDFWITDFCATYIGCM